MSQDRHQEPVPGIEEVRQHLASWREVRRAGQPMPEPLWTEAAALAAKHGVFRVAKGLGLEFSKLKKKVQERDGKPRRARASKAAGFVELPAAELLGAGSAKASGAVVELFGADGARLRISVMGPAAVDLPGLVAAFWRAERCCR